jgi:hypothetical protein
MGSKKSEKRKRIVTTKTNVVKLSYLQTLAVHQNLISADDLETKGFKTGKIEVSKKEESSLLGLGVFPSIGGLGKKKKSKTTVQLKSKGVKIKDQWLQPYYDRIRYAIGIKELSVARYKFAKTSEINSKPFISPKEIVKVNVVVDEYIPDNFSSNEVWIKYYIKVEGEEEWIRINPLNSPTRFDDTGEIIPKIVNFNLPKPTTAKLEDKFQFTEEPVKKVRLRAVLSRPDGENEESMTPMLKSYRIVMVPRES